MRRILGSLGMGLVLLASAPGYAADDKAEVFAAIKRLVAAANHSDVAGIEAEVAPKGTVIDDLPPYYWEGSHAFREWQAVVAGNWKLHGVTAANMTVQDSPLTDVTGDFAYAPEPAHFAIQAGAQKMEVEGTLTFSLVRIAGKWKVQSMTWAAK